MRERGAVCAPRVVLLFLDRSKEGFVMLSKAGALLSFLFPALAVGCGAAADEAGAEASNDSEAIVCADVSTIAGSWKAAGASPTDYATLKLSGLDRHNGLFEGKRAGGASATATIKGHYHVDDASPVVGGALWELQADGGGVLVKLLVGATDLDAKGKATAIHVMAEDGTRFDYVRP